jgi:hypothetical protein
MGQVELLYRACTMLGTLLFVLLFLHYYIEPEATDDDVEAAPSSTSKKASRVHARSSKALG